jgi:hypothetical protein
MCRRAPEEQRPEREARGTTGPTSKTRRAVAPWGAQGDSLARMAALQGGVVGVNEGGEERAIYVPGRSLMAIDAARGAELESFSLGKDFSRLKSRTALSSAGDRGPCPCSA